MLATAGAYKLTSAMLCGVAQTAPRLGERKRNLAACLDRLEEAAALGCSLVVLPECAISGYMLLDEEEAVRVAEPVPGTPASMAKASPSPEIDPAEAREKDRAIIPGEYEVSLFGDRRPELYGALVAHEDPVHAR